MSKAKAGGVRVELSNVIIHPTPASLRFGDDGWYATFSGIEDEVEEAMKLILLKKQRLKLTIEVDE